jgi:hypothetical protein
VAETCSVLKNFIKLQVLKTLSSVLNIDKPHKDGTKQVKEKALFSADEFRQVTERIFCQFLIQTSH